MGSAHNSSQRTVRSCRKNTIKESVTRREEILGQVEVAVTPDVKGKIDWTHSKEIQTLWSRKMFGFWFWRGTELSTMIEALKNTRKVLTDSDHRVNEGGARIWS